MDEIQPLTSWVTKLCMFHLLWFLADINLRHESLLLGSWAATIVAAFWHSSVVKYLDLHSSYFSLPHYYLHHPFWYHCKEIPRKNKKWYGIRDTVVWLEFRRVLLPISWVSFILTLEGGWGDEEDFFGSRRPEPLALLSVGPLEAAGGPIGPQAPGDWLQGATLWKPAEPRAGEASGKKTAAADLLFMSDGLPS